MDDYKLQRNIVLVIAIVVMGYSLAMATTLCSRGDTLGDLSRTGYMQARALPPEVAMALRQTGVLRSGVLQTGLLP